MAQPTDVRITALLSLLQCPRKTVHAWLSARTGRRGHDSESPQLFVREPREVAKIHITWTPGYLPSVLGQTSPLLRLLWVWQVPMSGLWGEHKYLQLELLDLSGVSVQKAVVSCAEYVCMARNTGKKWLQRPTTLATWRVIFQWN